MILIFSYQLLCFQSNTTVMLDVQTRELVFKAWPRNDSSREMLMCKQLHGDTYKLSVQVGTYTYVYPPLVLYDVTKYIQITIPCAEAPPGTCQSAFKGKSAIFTMEYQLGKQNVTEAVSNLRRLDFNRNACGDDPTVTSGRNVSLGPAYGNLVSNLFIFTATPKACKYPVDSMSVIGNNNPADKKAVMYFQAYPDYYLFAQSYSVSPQYFVQNQIYPCELLRYVSTAPRVVEACNELSEQLATSSFSYFSLSYFVPGIVPNRDGQLTRIVNYTSIYQSDNVKDTLQQMVDCYSSQTLKIFDKELLLQNTLNPSMVYCQLPIRSFVQYPYNRMLTRVIFQQYEDFRTGEVFTIDFESQSQVLNGTHEWLSCQTATNRTYCDEVLAKRDVISTYVLNAQKIFQFDDKTVQMVQLKAALELSSYKSASIQLMNTEACVQLSESFRKELIVPQNKQIMFSFGNSGIFSDNLLNISTQAIYPNSNNKYCMNYNFTEQQISSLTNVNVSGQIQIDDLMIPVVEIIDQSTASNVQNINLIIVAVVVFMAILVGISVWKPWV
ncbi:Conserved_hypothetical protein [Hexamita inflata]|uniref:Uncharacterized protein n=1 Tax=Hexamita inflata TaxID=28002 RepID=A0AA86TWK5_9EUKA|nr:Conserved hypothetical protein [Hexamita inflata]